MATSNSTSACQSGRVDVRRGWAGVDVEIDARTHSDYSGCSHMTLTYRGTIDAMLAAGCLTTFIMANRTGHRSGRPERDEHDEPFTLHRSPTKREPDRMKLTRSGEPTLAMQLPGVRELFPEGIAEPVPAEAQSTEPAAADTGPATAEDWKEERLDGMDSDLRFLESWNGNLWRGVGKYASPRFRFADGEIKRLDSILGRFRRELIEALEQAVVVDTAHADTNGIPLTRPPFLRLVIDNDSA
jgi:hypothetical protein